MCNDLSQKIFWKNVSPIWNNCSKFWENSSGKKAFIWMDFKNSFVWLSGMEKLIFNFNEFFGSLHFLVFFQDLMDRKTDRSQKSHFSQKSGFTCPSTKRRNFWNPFILRPYFYNSLSKLWAVISDRWNISSKTFLA